LNLRRLSDLPSDKIRGNGWTVWLRGYSASFAELKSAERNVIRPLRGFGR